MAGKKKDTDVKGEAGEPLVEKLLNFARGKQVITFDEINYILGADYVGDDSDGKMENILQLLSGMGVQVIEDGLDDLEDEGDEDDSMLDDDDVEETGDDELSAEDVDMAGVLDEFANHRLVENDKDSNVDDPIRLYLREIGKEKLLTAEQEVKYSKEMEEGENIIKDVIKQAGMMIPEFYEISQKAFKKIDPHEPGRPRKELNEAQAEKRRLKTCYGEFIKPVKEEMKKYMALKKQLFEANQSREVFDNPQLVELRAKIMPSLSQIDIQSEEIDRFSLKFSDAMQKIDEFHNLKETCNSFRSDKIGARIGTSPRRNPRRFYANPKN